MNTVTSSPNGDAPSVVDVDSAIDSDAVADRFAAVPRLLQPALERKGFEDLTEVQRAVLDAEAEGRDLQIFSQTGAWVMK